MADQPPFVGPMTRAEFARHVGRNRSTVSRWEQDGRLVFDGARIDVAASLRRIEQTRGLRDDVAARHAAARSRAAPPAAVPPAPGGDGIDTLEKASRLMRVAKAREQVAQAAIREMERDELRGDLVRRDVVVAVLDHVAAVVREGALNLAPRLVPQLIAAADRGEYTAIVDAEMSNFLAECAESWRRRAAEINIEVAAP